MTKQHEVTLRTYDGLHLAGTLVQPEGPAERAVVLVHGGGVTREEGGFFTRLADGLAEAGVASLRFDLRAHGESEGRREENTLSAILNDVSVALADVRSATGSGSGSGSVSLLGASFGGGVAAYYAAKRPEEIARLVLLNPQLDYKHRYLEQKPYWAGDFLDDEGAARLTADGYLQHSPTVLHGRAFLNEVFWVRPNLVMGKIQAPTLIVHGTRDTFVPVETSRQAAQELHVEHRLVEIEGAQHGFAVHDDPRYLNPQSQEWQALVIRTVADWLTAR